MNSYTMSIGLNKETQEIHLYINMNDLQDMCTKGTDEEELILKIPVQSLISLIGTH